MGFCKVTILERFFPFFLKEGKFSVRVKAQIREQMQLFSTFYDMKNQFWAAHWTYWLQILSELCFQRVALSGNYETVTISTDKNTFFNDLDYKADIGQHFHKSEKSARRRHRPKMIKKILKLLYLHY